jgi:mannan endo-1,4-beta-mannosidase
VAGATILAAQPAHAAAGFTVSGTRILDANGNAFVMRGINHAHNWYPSQTSSFANIKATGANTVRVVLSSGNRWTRNDAADVTNVINQCKTNRLVCVLEVHDTTGYGEEGAAATLAQAVDYWISIKSALAGQERYVILNIGNEPYGNTNASGWVADTRNAITRLRSNGFEHSIMVDAPNWGQDWQFIMRDNAASLFAADPQKNTIFSIHMYGVFDTAAEITDYLGRFQTANLPIVVGEFGNDHSDGNPDEDTIMATAQSRGIGYIGWSWSGNGSGVEYLDMTTNFNPSQLTTWGQRFINGANGIKATSREASIYSGTNAPSAPPSNPPSNPPSTPPTGGACSASMSVNAWNGGFVATVKVTAGGSALTGWSVAAALPSGTAVSNTWNAQASGTSGSVRFTNASHNGQVNAGGTAEFGFQGTGAAPGNTLSCTVG